MKRSEIIFSVLLVPVDFLMLVLAGVAAYFIRTSPLVANWRPVLFVLNLPFKKYFGIVLVVALFCLLIFAIAGLYRIKRTGRLIEEFSQLVIAISASLISIVIYIFIKREWFNSRFILLAAWVLAVIFVSLGRFFVRKLQRYLVARFGVGAHRVLVVGGDGVTQEITQEIQDNPGFGYRIVKHLPKVDLPIIRRVYQQKGIDDIILANPDFPRGQVLGLVNFCNARRINFKFVPNLFQTLTTNVEIDTLAAVPIIELKRTALDGWGKVIKKLVDVIGSLFGLIIFAPLMAIIALAIKLDSPGPVIYKNIRVGPKGKFKTYKFRSMKIECCTGSDYDKDNRASQLEDKLVKERSQRRGPVFKILNDPRRTKVGKLLERTSLDELPQFFNVLLGNMSLVGPRPHMPKEVSGYKKWHRKVFNIKPGLTGLAQISGRSDIDFDEEAKLDIYYLEKWSLALDFKIIFKTVFVVLLRKHRQ